MTQAQWNRPTKGDLDLVEFRAELDAASTEGPNGDLVQKMRDSTDYQLKWLMAVTRALDKMEKKQARS